MSAQCAPIVRSPASLMILPWILREVNYFCQKVSPWPPPGGQGMRAQTLRFGCSGRLSTRSRSASLAHAHDARYWLQLAPNFHDLQARKVAHPGTPTTLAAKMRGSARSDGTGVCMAIVESARPSHVVKELVVCVPAVACAAPPRKELRTEVFRCPVKR